MASTVRVHIAFICVGIAGAFLGGCGGGSGTSTSGTPASSTAAPTTPPPSAASNAVPMISGSPAASVAAGTAYSFHPTVTAPAGSKLSFVAKNLPKWAAFDASTGTISGTPAAADVGTTAQILLTVSDGAATAALAPFAIDVIAPGVATLSWTAPAANSAGETNLAGYHIYYGSSATALTHVVDVSNAASMDFVVNNLASGTWYFAITAYNSAKVESAFSAVVPVTI
jgi:hypothetical protein